MSMEIIKTYINKNRKMVNFLEEYYTEKWLLGTKIEFVDNIATNIDRRYNSITIEICHADLLDLYNKLDNNNSLFNAMFYTLIFKLITESEKRTIYYAYDSVANEFYADGQTLESLITYFLFELGLYNHIKVNNFRTKIDLYHYAKVDLKLEKDKERFGKKKYEYGNIARNLIQAKNKVTAIKEYVINEKTKDIVKEIVTLTKYIRWSELDHTTTSKITLLAYRLGELIKELVEETNKEQEKQSNKNKSENSKSDKEKDSKNKENEKDSESNEDEENSDEQENEKDSKEQEDDDEKDESEDESKEQDESEDDDKNDESDSNNEDSDYDDNDYQDNSDYDEEEKDESDEQDGEESNNESNEQDDNNNESDEQSDEDNDDEQEGDEFGIGEIFDELGTTELDAEFENNELEKEILNLQMITDEDIDENWIIETNPDYKGEKDYQPFNNYINEFIKRKMIKGKDNRAFHQGNAKQLNVKKYMRREYVSNQKLFDKEVNEEGFDKTSKIIFVLDISGSMGIEELKITSDYVKNFYDKNNKYLDIEIRAFGSKTLLLDRSCLELKFYAGLSRKYGSATKLFDFKFNKGDTIIILTDGQIHTHESQYKQVFDNSTLICLHHTSNYLQLKNTYSNHKDVYFAKKEELNKTYEEITKRIRKKIGR